LKHPFLNIVYRHPQTTTIVNPSPLEKQEATAAKFQAPSSKGEDRAGKLKRQHPTAREDPSAKTQREQASSQQESFVFLQYRANF
jgi:hypothetical protein